MNKKRGRFSIGIKIYLFVTLTVIVVSFASLLISYNVNVNQIDSYFKNLTLESARNFASFVDADFLRELRDTVITDEYQAIRDQAEEDDDEQPIMEYLQEKGLWKKYLEQRAMLDNYLDNMDDVKYLYIVFTGDADAEYDMYLLDDSENPIYETGYWEEREEDLLGFDMTVGEVEPSISTGDWGWLCSGFSPVRDDGGNFICQVGCDVSMDDIMNQRHAFLGYCIIGIIVATIIVLFIAVLLSRRIVVKPLNSITGEMKKFRPTEGSTYESAGVANLNINSRDEIGELYLGMREMQTEIVDYINDLSVMRNEKAMRDAELSVASRMQLDMLQTNFNLRDELSIYATMTPAKEMGGDFYDFFTIDDDHIGVVMADVSGKGIPAALFMVITKTLLKIRTTAPGTPASMLVDVNNTLCADNASNLFVTAWFAIITISTGEMIYANAGHEYPVIKRAGGDYEIIQEDNMPPLATVEDLEFEDKTTRLNPGDSLFLYTDGVPESKNSSGKRFGLDHMMDVLNKKKDATPKDLLSAMTAEIDSFTDGMDPFDDITMMNIVMK